MKHFAYSDAVNFLACQPDVPVTTADSIASFMPHLTKPEIDCVLACVKKNGVSYSLALPATLVADTVLLARIEPRVPGRNGLPMRLELSSRARRAGQTEPFIKYTKRALDFARKHWGKKLIPARWKSYVEVCMQDPGNRTELGYPRTDLVLGVALNRELNDILGDHSRQRTQLLDSCIAAITHRPVEGIELKGECGGFPLYNCSRCGSGLHLKRCSACKISFRDNQARTGWDTPLSEQLVEYVVRLGHRFAVHPHLARRVELDRWHKARLELELQQVAQQREQLELQLLGVRAQELSLQGSSQITEYALSESLDDLDAAVAFSKRVAREMKLKRKLASKSKKC